MKEEKIETTGRIKRFRVRRDQMTVLTPTKKEKVEMTDLKPTKEEKEVQKPKKSSPLQEELTDFMPTKEEKEHKKQKMYRSDGEKMTDEEPDQKTKRFRVGRGENRKDLTTSKEEKVEKRRSWSMPKREKPDDEAAVSCTAREETTDLMPRTDEKNSVTTTEEWGRPETTAPHDPVTSGGRSEWSRPEETPDRAAFATTDTTSSMEWWEYDDNEEYEIEQF